MAIDTEIQETLKSNNQSMKNMRRGDSPESSCQLPTAPAHSFLETGKRCHKCNQFKWLFEFHKNRPIPRRFI